MKFVNEIEPEKNYKDYLPRINWSKAIIFSTFIILLIWFLSREGGTASLIIILIINLYLLPSWIAAIRKVNNAGSVFVINFFLGWTIIGWFIALAMAAGSKATETAISDSQKSESDSIPNDGRNAEGYFNNSRKSACYCGRCGGKINEGDKFCTSCGTKV